MLYLVDYYFQSKSLISRLPLSDLDDVIFVDTSEEPTTKGIDALYERITANNKSLPSAVIGIGGGSTLDTAKAISNLLTNGGKAENYQGWDLVAKPGIFKIGIPTLSGTGAESSRTCVMINTQTGLKLGMNSDYSLFDQLILDPDLTETVPRNQYFYSGVDTFIHCMESLNGNFRNAIGDAFAREALRLSREVFMASDMMECDNREKLMVASYLGGCAIAHSYVGLVHPFSAGLSVVLGLRHGEANCIALRALRDFYPQAVDEFETMICKQGVYIRNGICRNLSSDQLSQLYRATIIHEKPLSNALGEEFKSVLSKDKVINIFSRM